ncbi:MAG TPA: hypothetical protein VKS01_02150 [Bryobacteraceae bacterium]|nr:hypothetical protein [Bryobacteraceae bacterium]
MTAPLLPPTAQRELDFSLSLLRIAAQGNSTEQTVELEQLAQSVSNLHVLAPR